MINIGLLGFGTVGQGVVDIVQRLPKVEFLNVEELNIKKILVKNLDKEREVIVPKEKLTLNPYEIIEDKEIDIIIEVTGDVPLSYEILKAAMKNKKHVVTANKALVSAYFEELSHYAEENGVYFLYEASVAGGIPLVKTLKDLIALNRITNIKGILNGSSNYILTRMTDDGLDYEDALKEAQMSGYSEANPSSDIDGTDTLRKLRILSTLAFGVSITEDDIISDGIDKLKSLDIKLLKDRGLVIKLIGEATEAAGRYRAIVQPRAMKREDHLSKIKDAYNSVSIEGEFSGILNFYGPGAGMHATANSVLTDVLDCVMKTQDISNPLRSIKLENRNVDIKGRYYLRITNWKDKDYHVLEGLMNEKLFQDEDELAIITEELKLYTLLDKIAEMDKPFALVEIQN